MVTALTPLELEGFCIVRGLDKKSVPVSLRPLLSSRMQTEWLGSTGILKARRLKLKRRDSFPRNLLPSPMASSPHTVTLDVASVEPDHQINHNWCIFDLLQVKLDSSSIPTTGNPMQ